MTLESFFLDGCRKVWPWEDDRHGLFRRRLKVFLLFDL